MKEPRVRRRWFGTLIPLGRCQLDVWNKVIGNILNRVLKREIQGDKQRPAE